MPPTDSEKIYRSPKVVGSAPCQDQSLDLRNDVYRRPLQTAMERLGLGLGWRCADMGAGGGDVTVALAALVGPRGRVYAIDIDPARRDEVAEAAAAAGEAQVVAITQAAEELVLPEHVDMAFCRFLLLHVVQPLAVVERMASITRPGGWVVLQEPVTSAGRVDGQPFSMPAARHPDVGALLPALVLQAGLELVDAWAESQAGAGPGPVHDYLQDLTGVRPGPIARAPTAIGYGHGPHGTGLTSPHSLRPDRAVRARLRAIRTSTL